MKHFYWTSNIMNNILFMSFLLVAAAACVHEFNIPRLPLMTKAFCLAASIAYYLFLMNRPNKVYLVDFACYKPSLSSLCSKEMIIDRAKKLAFLSEENMKLITKILDRYY